MCSGELCTTKMSPECAALLQGSREHTLVLLEQQREEEAVRQARAAAAGSTEVLLVTLQHEHASHLDDASRELLHSLKVEQTPGRRAQRSQRQHQQLVDLV